MRRWAYFLAGAIALVLGCAGIVLPLVPTTPFLLLASYCFARSSPAAQRWLLAHPWFGVYVRDWEQHRGVRRSVKVVAVSMVALVVTLSFALRSMSAVSGTILLSLAGIGLTVIWRLPVVKGEPQLAPLHPAEPVRQPELAA